MPSEITAGKNDKRPKFPSATFADKKSIFFGSLYPNDRDAQTLFLKICIADAIVRSLVKRFDGSKNDRYARQDEMAGVDLAIGTG